MPVMSDARQVITDYLKLSGSTGSHSISRREQLRLRVALIEVTLDSDTSTTIDLNAVGLTNPIVVAIDTMVVDSDTTGNWDVEEHRGAAASTLSYRVDYFDGTASSPYTINISDVGTRHQGQLARVLLYYLEREP